MPAPWPHAGRITLVRCLWLAALLHGLALWALGRTPGGAPATPREPARLEVTLRSDPDARPTRPPAATPPRTPAAAQARPAGPAPQPLPLPPSTAGSPPAETPGAATALTVAPQATAVAAGPAHAASAPRPLNLELGRWRSAEAGPPGVARTVAELQRLPEPDPLAAAIEKTGRADCTRAYAGAGLLALVPLMLDAARGTGCKW
ncbi:MAG: hypothetical protein ACKO3M_12450 [Rubrivivax sp.]